MGAQSPNKLWITATALKQKRASTDMLQASQGSTEIRGGQRKSRRRFGRLARDYREGRIREICTTGGQHKGNLYYRQVKISQAPWGSGKSRGRSGRLARDYREGGIREIYTTGKSRQASQDFIGKSRSIGIMGIMGIKKTFRAAGWLGTKEWAVYPVVIITCVHYLGPPGSSTS